MSQHMSKDCSQILLKIAAEIFRMLFHFRITWKNNAIMYTEFMFTL